MNWLISCECSTILGSDVEPGYSFDTYYNGSIRSYTSKSFNCVSAFVRTVSPGFVVKVRWNIYGCSVASMATLQDVKISSNDDGKLPLHFSIEGIVKATNKEKFV